MNLTTALETYRAEPTNRNAAAAYREVKPVAVLVAGDVDLRGISLGLDDLVNYVAHTSLAAARRFTFFCPLCRDVFVDRQRLMAHGEVCHALRGLGPRVEIRPFCLTSSRMAVRRYAYRLRQPEVVHEDLDYIQWSVDPGDAIDTIIQLGRILLARSISPSTLRDMDPVDLLNLLKMMEV